MPALPAFTPLAKALMMRRLLKPALLGATLASTLSVSMLVQAQEIEFNIGAQPVSNALLEFGRQSGVQVLFEPSAVQRIRSNPLRGRLSVATAIAELLRGTGLRYSLQGDTITVTGGETSDAVQLGVTNVSGQGLGAITENTGSYTTGSANTATKLALSPRETPQSTSVITRQRIEDQGMTTLSDVVKYTPGLTLNQWGGERPRFNARGFGIENLMFDGVPVAYEEAALSTGSLAMYDRVEVVRGAAGLMEGAGLPSGSINLIRKRPTVTPQVSVTGGLGSWDNQLFEIDASSALNEQGSLRGRTVLSYQKKDSFIDDYSNERTLLYGIVEADVTDDTTVSLGVSYSDENNPGADWNGMGTYPDGSFLPISRSTRMSPSWSYWNKESTTVFADIEHRFDNGWKAKGAATYITSEMNMQGTFISNSSIDANGNPSMTLRGGAYDYDRDQYSFDGYFSGPFDLLGRTHSLVVGGSRRVSKWDNLGGPFKTQPGFDSAAFDLGSFDPTNWDPSAFPRPALLEYGAVGSEQRIEQSSAYTTARFSLADPLTFIAGARLDWYKLDKVQYDGDFPWGEANFKVTRKVTPYFGLVYDLNDTYSVYASATKVFQPQSEQSASGTVLKPIEGTNYEIGLKGEHFDGRLNSSIAIFQINLENLPEAIPTSLGTCFDPFATCYTAAGEIRSRGIEFELSGALTENWQVSAGYTYNTAERIKDSAYDPIGTFTKGKRYGTNLPANLFKLATTYRLPDDLKDWRVGGAMRTQSKIYTPFGVEQGGYTVYDLFTSYDVNRNLQVNLNLNNVFDKHYYSTITAPTEANFFGEPRNFMVTARYKFF
ncbi:TonB-dependent siderophore receptor [Pseudomonas rubra]|uniref:TonB-dependent siderophore receptor n=1 Tax=Pseudomonas rubra TaxID=2942627 RepID=A0ABT5PCP0_9PSED|nr:TonB-dependent siderophore receptor [Pseudomonas rubra]MDD1015724.1 TonB-dependent siderophore receptor [Pseudomonas rubra]MDD1040346.1 TonB-dependent siderophore receptor [Pseudomonas rubra]MDD1157448.1 TonB-dependent siderophore receptor [Pseudomonas rubra]